MSRVAAPVPSYIPNVLNAGDSWQWTLALADYPADTWTATYYLRGLGKIDVAGVADDAGHLFSATAAETGAVLAGSYRYVLKVDDGAGTIETVDAGVVTVRADFATADAGDLQTHAERALALIEAALEGRVTDDVESYQILGRAVSHIPLSELRKLRAQYRSEVALATYGGKLPDTQVQFGRP